MNIVSPTYFDLHFNVIFQYAFMSLPVTHVSCKEKIFRSCFENNLHLLFGKLKSLCDWLLLRSFHSFNNFVVMAFSSWLTSISLCVFLLFISGPSIPCEVKMSHSLLLLLFTCSFHEIYSSCTSKFTTVILPPLRSGILQASSTIMAS